jgi:hypothetical protein
MRSGRVTNLTASNSTSSKSVAQNMDIAGAGAGAGAAQKGYRTAGSLI